MRTIPASQQLLMRLPPAQIYSHPSPVFCSLNHICVSSVWINTAGVGYLCKQTQSGTSNPLSVNRIGWNFATGQYKVKSLLKRAGGTDVWWSCALVNLIQSVRHSQHSYCSSFWLRISQIITFLKYGI